MIGMTEFPAFELLVDPDALTSLQGDLAAFGAGGEAGVDGTVPSAWLTSEAGDHWCISVEVRDLKFKFEVFRLVIETPSKILARLAVAPTEVPDYPGVLSAPATMQNWPFAEWDLNVLRRRETDGTSSCDVAVGLLFSAAEEQLLIAVDDWPFGVRLSQSSEKIEDYLSRCERVPAAEYATRYLRT